jgi:hypothetical protein
MLSASGRAPTPLNRPARVWPTVSSQNSSNTSIFTRSDVRRRSTLGRRLNFRRSPASFTASSEIDASADPKVTLTSSDDSPVADTPPPELRALSLDPQMSAALQELKRAPPVNPRDLKPLLNVYRVVNFLLTRERLGTPKMCLPGCCCVQNATDTLLLSKLPCETGEKSQS